MKKVMALAVAFASLASAGMAARRDALAIVGARVVTVTGPVYDSATVVVRDGLIEAVGPGVAAPADARVVDGKGLTVTPGIIDGFGGVGLPAPARGAGGGASPAPSASPASGALAPQALALDRVRPAEALKARDQGITTALVIPKEGVLPGRSVILNLSGEKAEGMVLKQPAALHLNMTSLSRQYPGSLMGTVAYARQALYDARRYREEWTDYERSPRGKQRPRYDAALEAWQDVLARREPLVVTATRENDIRRALELADEFKIKVEVAGAPQASRLAGLIKQRSLPLLVSVNFDPPRPAVFFGAEDEERERKDIEEAQKNPAELHKAGVRFALVSGYASSFLDGIRKAIEKGLPREAALKAVTLDAAEALGIADRTGSIETGKIANLVAWSGEPLAKEAKVKMVFIDGQPYEPEERPDRRGEPSPSPELER